MWVQYRVAYGGVGGEAVRELQESCKRVVRREST